MDTYKVKLECDNCKHIFDKEIKKGVVIRRSDDSGHSKYLFIGTYHKKDIWQEYYTEVKGFWGTSRKKHSRVIVNPIKTNFIKCPNCEISRVDYFKEKEIQTKTVIKKVKESSNNESDDGMIISTAKSLGLNF